MPVLTMMQDLWAILLERRVPEYLVVKDARCSPKHGLGQVGRMAKPADIQQNGFV